MTDTRKVQLGAEFDASGVRKGTQEAKDAVRDMARDVQASGQQAGKGFEGIGAGAEGAGQRVDRATKGIIGSIERATAALKAGQKGSADYFEQLANARGANADVLRPYIEQLRQAERAQKVATDGLGAMGVSANQTRAALRQLPAQFTDIFTSLSSGQAPLTVLIQQGGQIKDSFGGIGPALRGVAGAISPVAVGLGALVGGAVAAAAAFFKGQAESQAYTAALVLSGNAAGATAGQLQDLARSMGGVVGTQAQAAAVITQLAASGRVAAADIGKLAEAAIRLERAGGPAAQKTAEAFADLAKSPVAATLKLNESTRFLTVEVLEQIRALEEQGRTFEAARVAQEAYADAAVQRAGQLEKRLGTLQNAWRAVADAAKGAWDAALDIGREETLTQRLDSLQAKLGILQRIGEGGGGLLAVAADRAAGGVRGDIAATNRSLLNQADRAAQQRADALLVEQYEKARAANQRWADATLSNTEKVNKALDEYRRNLATINEGLARANLPAVSDAEVRAQEAAIRRSILGTKELSAAERERQTVLEASRDAAKQWADAITDFQGIQAKAEAGADGLNEAQRRVVQLLTSPAWKQASEPMRQLAIQSFTAANNALEHAEAEKQRAKALADAEAASKRYLQELDRSIDGAERQVQALQDEFVELTRGKDAREALVQQRLDDAAAQAAQTLQQAEARGVGEEEYARLSRLADKLREVADLRRGNTEQRTANDAADQARKAVEEARRESERWMSDLQSGLTDVFRQAFLAGGNFGKAFARGLAAEVQAQLATALATLLAEAVLGLGVRAAGAVVGAAGGGSGWGNMLQAASTAKNAYDLYAGGGMYAAAGNYAAVYSGSAYGTAFGSQQSAMLAAQEAGMVSQAGASTMSTWGAYAGWAALIAAAVMKAASDYDEGFRSEGARQLQDDLGGGVQGWLLGGLTADFSNLAKKIGFNDKWADLLSGATGVAKLFGRSIPRVESEGVTGNIMAGDFSGNLFADIKQKGGIFRSDKRWTELAALPDDLGRFLDEGAAGVYRQAQEFGKALGLPAQQLAGVTTALRVEFARPENDSKEAVAEAAKKNVEAIGKALGQYGDDLVNAWAEAVKPLAQYGESAAQTIARVGQALLDVNSVLESIGVAALATSVDGGAAAVALADLFGGLHGLQQAASGYAQNFLSEAERMDIVRGQLSEAFAEYGATLPDTREQFRALVEAQDLTTDAGRRAYAALLGVADAFAAVTPSADEAAAAAAELQRSVAGITDRFLTEAERTAAEYQRAAQRLGGLGIDVGADQLLDATREQVRDFVLSFVELRDVSAATKQAVLDVAGSLLDLKDAAAGGFEAAIDGIYAASAGSYAKTASGALSQASLERDFREYQAASRSDFVAEAVDRYVQQQRQYFVDLNAAKFAIGRGVDPATYEPPPVVSLDAVTAFITREYLRMQADSPSAVDVAQGIAASVSATNAAAEETRRLIEAMTGLGNSLDKYRDDLTLGSLSALSPEARYDAARQMFDATVRQAMSGDQAAREELQARSSAFLQASRAYYGSGSGYAADFGAVSGALGRVIELLNTLNGNTEAGNSVAVQGFARVADATQGTTAAVRTQAERSLLLAQRGVE